MDSDLNKKQNKKLTIFACFISIVSIGLLIFGFLIVSSDKVVMLQSISNLSNKFSALWENETFLIDKLATSSDIGIRSNIEFISDNNDISLTFDYLENKKDQKSTLDFNLAHNQQLLLNTNISLSDNNLYFYIDNITSHLYFTHLPYFSFLSGLSSNQYDKIMTLFKESIIDYLDNQDIKKESSKISYHDKEKRVHQLTYEITNKTIQEIMTNFIHAIESDKTLLESICSYFNISEEGLIVQFDQFLSLLDYQEIHTEYYYRVYYYGFNQIVLYELEDAEMNAKIQYKIDNQESIHIYQNDTELFSLTITKNKEDYELAGFLTNNGQVSSYTGSISDDKMTILVHYLDKDYQFVISSSNQISEDNYLYQYQIHLFSLDNKKETSLFLLDMDYEYYFGKKTKIDTKNSVDIHHVSEEELASLRENILNHPIFQFFSSFLDETI